MRGKQSDAWALGWFAAACLALMMVIGWQALRADIISTTDGLSMNVNAEGRVTGLTMDGQGIDLSGHGGFYVRDNTLGENGLPGNAENLLACGDFETHFDENCYDCFESQGTWKHVADDDLTAFFTCYDFPLPGGQTATARVEINENIPGAHYGIFFQDLDLGSAPAEQKLYCLTFDVATECGWRPYIHPADHEADRHGDHLIEAVIEWFSTEPPSLGITNETDDRAIASTTAYAYETSTNLTRFALESYRPLAPAPAIWARIKIVVEGYLPNDGRTPPLRNSVVFDNFAFYEAQPIQEVYGVWPSLRYEELYTYVEGQPVELGLSMKTAAHGNGNHILFHAELRNDQADSQKTRQLDLGFALPIGEDGQQLKWWDDGNTPVPVSDNIPVKTYPYRFAASADTRSASVNEHKLTTSGPLMEKPFRQRGEDLRISAYPFSALTIVKDNTPFGLSFGDDLLSSPLTISNYGYRVKCISDFEGTYYIEFALGMLARAADPDPDQADARFGFVLFRSDDPSWTEKSTFKKAAEKYQRDIFSTFFTRPINSGDDWLFGGGSFTPQPGEGGFDTHGFDDHPQDFGIRYSNHRYLDTVASRDGMIAGIDWFGPEVSVSTYDAPWAAFFRNAYTDPDSDMNTHYRLGLSMDSHHPNQPPWSEGDLWDAIYQAKKANALRLPSVPSTELTPPVWLFSRHIDSRPTRVLETYSFPTLLADPPIGDADLVSEELAYVTKTYEVVSKQSLYGINGPLYDNVFYDQDRADHLDVPDDSTYQRSRLRQYVNSGLTLTYSISYLQPAIPQLALNAAFLDHVRLYLDEIDEDPALLWGDGMDADHNVRDEVLTGNMNDPSYGGSKHGMLRADLFGFESSPVLDSNNDAQAFSFRRTLARDKNVARVFNSFPCIEEMLDEGWLLCDQWADLWLTWELLYQQIANEAIWMALTWGFHPDLVALFPGADDPGSYLDDFVDTYLRPIFATDHGPGQGYTNIFKSLHRAGWRPITNAVPHKGNPSNPTDVLPLYVERFGDGPLTSEESARYFTVLNNDDLKFTIVQIVEEDSELPVKLSEIPDMQTLEDRATCAESILDCTLYPHNCPEDLFDHKEFYLDISNADRLGLWNYNVHGVQLVYEPGNHPQVCNCPQIQDAAFGEGPNGDNVYSIKRLPSLLKILRIGGIWETAQEKATIPDKALMVFKLWSSRMSDNGEGQASAQGSTDDSTSGQGPDIVTPYYERYGDGWQTVPAETAIAETVDVASAGSTDTVAVYKIHVGSSGQYRIQVRFPQSANAASGALYQIYLVDYLETPVGPSEPGTPILSTVIDQADTDAYEAAMDEEGYITLGNLNVSLTEGEEVKTVVCRLTVASAASDDSVLLADAVRLDPLE